MAGAYDAKAVEYEQIAVFTNKVATDAYRGAGGRKQRMPSSA